MYMASIYSLCLESSKTDNIKISMVYLHSGAKALLQNSFLVHQYIASSVYGDLQSSFGKHFFECCTAVLS